MSKDHSPDFHTPIDPSSAETEKSRDIPPHKKRKLIRRIAGIALLPIALVALAGVLLYIPAIQSKVVTFASRKVSESTGYQIRIKRVRIGFPLKVKVGQVLATEAPGDTVAYLDNANVEIALLPLLKGQVNVSGGMLDRVRLRYFSPDSLLSITGHIGKLHLSGFSYDSKKMLVEVGKLSLEDTRAAVFYGDTTPKADTATEKSKLRILLDEVYLDKLLASYAQVRDSDMVNIDLHKGRLKSGDVNLEKGYYKAKKLLLEGRLYRIGTQIEGLPLPWDLSIDSRKVHYDSLNIQGTINHLEYYTADHWGIRRGVGTIDIDSTHLQAKDLILELQRSSLALNAEVPMRRFKPDSAGNFSADVKGVVYLREFQRFLKKNQDLPENAIRLNIEGKGTMQDRVDLTGSIDAQDIAELKVAGRATQITDSIKRKVRLDYHLAVGNAMQYLHYLGIHNPSWDLPEGTLLDGELTYSTDRISTTALMQTSSGTVRAEGTYTPLNKEYKGDVMVNALNLQQLLPKDSLTYLNGVFSVEGKGTDPFSPRTHAKVFAEIDSVVYKGEGFSDITLLSRLRDQQFFATLNSANEGLNLSAQVDAMLKRNDLQASINLLVDTLIPSRIGIDSQRLRGASFGLRSVLRSDLKEFYEYSGEIENSFIATDKRIINPGNIYLSAHTSTDSLSANVTSGDLTLDFHALNGLKDFLSRVKYLQEEVKKVVVDTIAIQNMRPWIDHYPTMKVRLSMGRLNPLRFYLDDHRLGWRSLSVNIGTTTKQGLYGDVYVNSFQRDTFRIDEMDMTIRQDTAFFYAVASVHKERFRNQKPFNLLASISTNIKRTELYTNWKDSKGDDFILLGLDATKEADHDITVRFTPDLPILAYNQFNVAENSYITIPTQTNDKPIKAAMELSSADGAKIIAADSLTEKGSALVLKVRNFGLEKVKSLSIIPDMDGIVNANLQWMRTDKRNAYAGDLAINNFRYSGKSVGNIFAKGSMTPEGKGDKVIGQLSLDGKEAADALAYIPQGKDTGARWRIEMKHLPMEKVNPFLPRDYAEVRGFVDALLYNYQGEDIASSATEKINGNISLHESDVFVPLLNERYKIETQPIRIENDRAYLQNFTIVANETSRLVTDGTVTLNENIPLNLRIRGNNMKILDSKQTSKTSVFGTIGADASIRLQGPVKNLDISGSLSVNGSTHIYYVSKDSELKKRNRFAGLVEFTDFSDTLFVVKKNNIDSLSLGGMNVRLNLHIDPAVRATALLSRDGSNKVYLQGGGDFNFSMPPYGKMSLAGSYDIGDGYIHYSMPAMGKKQFFVDRSSRVTWSGDVMNPDIHFKASAKVKSDVSLPGETPRKVAFNVSILARNTLDDLALLFDLEAPEDLSMRNVLASMTEEERSRQAVILLATGRFLGSESTGGGFDANMALSSLLASELNSLVTEAFDAEINLGVEEGSAEMGGGLNYSYSIAKKFYNDRISVMIGGKVQTGSNPLGFQQSFIDNMSLDYRLDEAGTHYLQLFHKKNYENLLDGEVIETGAGYILRRKLTRIQDIFKFRSNKKRKSLKPLPLIIPSSNDSIMKKPDSLRLERKHTTK